MNDQLSPKEVTNRKYDLAGMLDVRQGYRIICWRILLARLRVIPRNVSAVIGISERRG